MDFGDVEVVEIPYPELDEDGKEVEWYSTAEMNALPHVDPQGVWPYKPPKNGTALAAIANCIAQTRALYWYDSVSRDLLVADPDRWGAWTTQNRPSRPRLAHEGRALTFRDPYRDYHAPR